MGVCSTFSSSGLSSPYTCRLEWNKIFRLPPFETLSWGAHHPCPYSLPKRPINGNHDRGSRLGALQSLIRNARLQGNRHRQFPPLSPLLPLVNAYSFTMLLSKVLGVIVIARNGDRYNYYQDPFTYAGSNTETTALGEVYFQIQCSQGSDLRSTVQQPGPIEQPWCRNPQHLLQQPIPLLYRGH